MQPISPNTGAPEIVIAKDQPEYLPLPAAVYENSYHDSPQLLTRYTLSDEERKAVAAGEDIYIAVLTFGKPYPPMQVLVGPQHFMLHGDIAEKLGPDDKRELADFQEAVKTGECPYCHRALKPKGESSQRSKQANPYERDGKWYFADETESENGPFPTKERAELELAAYCAYLEGQT